MSPTATRCDRIIALIDGGLAEVACLAEVDRPLTPDARTVGDGAAAWWPPPAGADRRPAESQPPRAA